MHSRIALVIGGVLTVALAAVVAAPPGKALNQPSSAGAAAKDEATPSEDHARQTDEQAIRKQSQAFTQAFSQGDAKALANLCTTACEYIDHNNGEAFRGRAAIQKAFGDLFTQHPKARAEVEISDIRFLGRDTAVEEGLVRVQLPGPTLPSSSHYRVLHVREDGKWYVALIEERGAQHDKLGDLGWLVGSWVIKAKQGEARLIFTWNQKKTQILCHATVKETGKPALTSKQMISFDPHRGQLCSWIYNEEGGHGQAYWTRDGQQWVLEALGVMPDGTATTATNILKRVNDDQFTWHSVERMAGAQHLPDRDLVTANRVKTAQQ